MKGWQNQVDYGMRIYDPRIAKFLSVDPLTKDYPWYTPYQFAGNTPIQAIDLDGMEPERPMSFSPAIPFFPPAKARTPLGYMNYGLAHGIAKFQNSRVGKVLNGVGNVALGLVGTVASIGYIEGTAGAGAAAGGATALFLSLGEVSIGISQISEALYKNLPENDYLHDANTLPGLFAYGTGNDYAPFIDALGAFTPAIVSSGGPGKMISLSGLIKSGGGVLDAAKTLKNSKSVYALLNTVDNALDAGNFILKSFKLVNEISGLGMERGYNQIANASLTYTVRQGDNLTNLAKRYNTTVDQLVKDNNISDRDNLKAGQQLKFNYSAQGRVGGN